MYLVFSEADFMAKLNWEKVRVEELDLRHKAEIERKLEEESRLLFKTEDKKGMLSLVKCPRCHVVLTASKYDDHFFEFHYLEAILKSADIAIFIVNTDEGYVLIIVAHKFAENVEGLSGSIKYSEENHHELINMVVEAVVKLYEKAIGKYWGMVLYRTVSLVVEGAPRKKIKSLGAKTLFTIEVQIIGFEQNIVQSLLSKIQSAVSTKPQLTESKHKGRKKK